jgi:hypothetical protein
LSTVVSVTVQQNFRIAQGSRFRYTLTVLSDGLPVDLTGWSARMQIRPTLDSDEVLGDYTTENGMLIVGDGTVAIRIPSSETEDYEWESGVYDLEIVTPAPDSDAIRILQGWVACTPQVTR